MGDTETASMKAVFLLCVLPYALASTSLLEQAAPQHSLNLAQMVHDLFTARDDRAIISDDEEGVEVERKMDDEEEVSEKQEVHNPAIINKYNDMVDNIYKKMNSELRAKQMDPMTLDINKARKRLETREKKKEEKRERKHSVEKRQAEEIEEEDDLELVEMDEMEVMEEGEARKMNPKHEAHTKKATCKKKDKDGKKKDKDSKKKKDKDSKKKKEDKEGKKKNDDEKNKNE